MMCTMSSATDVDGIRRVVHLCPICRLTTSTLPQWFSHLRSAHSSDPSFYVTCGIDGCKKTYSKFSALNTHVYRHHKERMQEKAPSKAPQMSSQQSTSHFEQGAVQTTLPDAECDVVTDEPTLTVTENQRHSSALFLLDLKEGRGLSQVAVNSVIEGCERIVDECIQKVRTEVVDRLQESHLSSIIPDMEDIFQNRTEPFDGLRNKYQQEKYYEQEFQMTQPVEKQLGKQVYKLCGSGSKRRRVLSSESSFYYIPLLSTLRKVLARGDVLEQVSVDRRSTNGYLEDFCDGSEFKNHPLFQAHPSALQIIGYYDELEVCNPLGTGAKIHKLGIFLFTISNLPPKFRSSLKCLFLFAVAKASDVKKYTTDAILAPFISDINTLATDGVTVTYCNRTLNFKGSLLAFLADNLASHAIGGFKESFSKTFRFCRNCLATRDKASKCFLSDAFTVRTTHEHRAHCALLQGNLGSFHSTTYGINRWSTLGDIDNFSIVKCLPFDIMHDLLEGIFPNELSLFLNHCLVEKYFSIKDLNMWISTFDFGYSECSNKPAPIQLLSATTVKVHQKAAQMWLLVRMLPFLIGHYMPIDDEAWQCFCLLLDILDICTSHICSLNAVAYFKTLIEEHHLLFQSVYPDASIIPKMHFIVHYPEQILKFGPLIRSWTLRYEAKLKLCKQVAKFGNFKNICLSVAQKHERWLCYQLQGAFYLRRENLEVGGHCRSVRCGDEPLSIGHLLANQAFSISNDAQICHPSWVKYFNSTYKVNGVVVLRTLHLPVFGQICDILVLPDSTVLFHVTNRITKYFDQHYHAFMVEQTLSYDLVSFSCLTYPFVLHLYKNSSKEDSNLYVSLKYGIYCC